MGWQGTALAFTSTRRTISQELLLVVLLVWVISIVLVIFLLMG